mgnify:CR=1 FL=1
MPYKLTQKNNNRLSAIAEWLNVDRSLLLRKMLENQLDHAETVQETVTLTENIIEKYELAASLRLLED